MVPHNIYVIYNFFNKTRDDNWKENPFIFFKTIHNREVKIARNISHLNYYQIDIPFNKKINPLYMIKYFKNIDYRNVFSPESISFKMINKIDDNKWIEEEKVSGTTNRFNCLLSHFTLLFYNENWSIDQSLSQSKYYHCYSILNKEDTYILRFDIALNSLDIDQEIDINIYIILINNLLKAIYKKFKIE